MNTIAQQILAAAVLGSTAAELCVSFTPVGSRVTCNPAPKNTDADYLAFVHRDDFKDFVDALSEQFDPEGSAPENTSGLSDRFRSFRCVNANGDTINIIATDDSHFERKFLAATSIAKRLNLLDKRDRIALFQAVLYGNADKREAA